MKFLIYCVLLIASASLMHAGIIYTLTIDLSVYHPGSTLSGSVTVASPILPGGSTPLTMTFSDPGDYNPTSLMTTLRIGNGINADTVRFDPMTFTNLGNNTTINMMVKAPAQCPDPPAGGVPCHVNGLWQDGDPPRFSGTYTIDSATVPEPSYGLLLTVLVAGLALRRHRKFSTSMRSDVKRSVCTKQMVFPS